MLVGSLLIFLFCVPACFASRTPEPLIAVSEGVFVNTSVVFTISAAAGQGGFNEVGAAGCPHPAHTPVPGTHTWGSAAPQSSHTPLVLQPRGS